ncbi:MAG: glycosyltransferase family 39 protein [Caldilineaceae bacterium]
MNHPTFLAHSSAERTKRWLLHALLAAAALAWTVFVLAFYYSQLWRLLLGDWSRAEPQTVGILAFIGGTLLLAATAAVFAWAVRRMDRRAYTRVARWTCVAVITLVALAFLALTLVMARQTTDPALPYLRQALERELAGIGAALFLLSAALALGLGISRALGWHYAGWRERLPFGGALGIAAFGSIGFLLATFGLYRPYMLQVLTALVLLAAIFVLAPGILRQARSGRHLSVPRIPRNTTLLWIACVGLALFCAGIAALAPETQYDALWYHLTYPQRYLQTGYLVDIPADFVSLYPMTTELWYGHGLALGGATAAFLLHLGYLPLAAVLTYEFARRYTPGATPWLAVALLLTMPTMIWLGSTANTDLAIMLFVALALYAVLRYVDTSRRQWLLLAALNLGFALSTKHLALFALALFCPGLLLTLRSRGVSWRRAFLAALALGSLSLLVALPWYLRSYLATGNPVFETMYTIFGAPPERWNALAQARQQAFLHKFGGPRTLANLLLLPWDMTIHAAGYAGTLGPLFLILLPMLVLRRLRGIWPWLAALVALWLLLWFSPTTSLEVRQLIPIAPVLAALAALAFARVAGLARLVAGSAAPALLAGSLAVLMVLNLPPFTPLHEVDRVNWDGWLSSVLYRLPWSVVAGGQSVDDYLTREIRSYPVWQYADAHLPPGARVLTWSGGDEFYTHHDRLWANSAPAIATSKAPRGAEAQALARLCALGITHLIVGRRPPEEPNPWDAYALTSPLARSQWYEELYSDYWYVLYRIRWEALH